MLVHDRDSWSYLGTPLNEQTMKALDSVLVRVKQATTKVAEFAAPHPKQAFHLFNATVGACRVEYLLHTLTHSAADCDVL